jgi:cation:H+ antiporter
MLIPFIIFILLSLLILYSGSKLSKYGDMLAEKTGLGKLWIGVVLLAFITSLPELITGFSSIVIFNAPDIAAGDIFGSCVFNILILAILDLFDSNSPISSRVHQRHTLSASFGILLISVICINLLVSYLNVPLAILSFGWVGIYTPIIIVMYLTAMWLIFSHEKKERAAFLKERAEELKEDLVYEKITLKSIYINFAINSLIVVTAATFLPDVGLKLAEATGLGETFIGNALIAFSTSLPEIVVSVAALRIGASDMAIGNLFGSNIFNIGILAFDDILFTKGPLLSFIDLDHLVSGLSAIIMMTIAIIGITYRARRKQLILSWDALAIVTVYILNIVTLYMLK